MSYETPEQAWNHYRSSVLGPHATADEIHDRRMAFFAGMQATHEFMARISSDPAITLKFDGWVSGLQDFANVILYERLIRDSGGGAIC